MPDEHPLDAEIAARYTRGESTSDIARALGLRMPVVIGRVREMGLRPPHAQAGQDAVAREIVAAAPAAEIRDGQRPAPPRRARATGTATSKVALLASDHAGQDGHDDDEDHLVRRGDRPRGWLVTEEELDRMFAGDRYEDVRLKDDEKTRYGGYMAAKRTSNPVVLEAARRAYHSK